MERKIEFNITKAEEGAAFAVHVVPKSVKSEVAGKHGDALKIKLNAMSAKGAAANAKLIDFIAEKLGVEPKNVEIAAGQNSTEKMIVVVGMPPTTVEETLLG